ncbi:MAG: hypothetical protein NUW08_03600 [Candidatus Uhrbacteria bacterium]|nr:hypothetical protein [Candidatus Uhrbacteria bacterium]
MSAIEIVVLPRRSMTWEEFCAKTPPRSIALDGMVRGGPNWCEDSLHVNFDHHEGVVREATMSSAKQVYFAIKSGLMRRFDDRARVFVNDPDQDTSFAIWLLMHHHEFSGVQSHPAISRLLELNDRWDITGGAFPMSLDQQRIRQHCWIFAPYTDLRKSGELATAGEAVMRNTLTAVFARLTAYMFGQAEEKELDTRYEILHNSSKYGYHIVDEIGGNEARYHLFAQGVLDGGYVSLVAKRPDGRRVYTIGRASRYVDFPVRELYDVLNKAEGLVSPHGWNGSDLIGGSDREQGSGLDWPSVRDAIEPYLEARQSRRHRQD